MIVTNPAVKKSLSDASRIEFINDMVESYFMENEKGEVEYVPYYSDRAFQMYFYVYCVDGIQFEKVKAEDGGEVLENIWGAINSHSEVLDLFRKYTEGKLVSCPILVSQLEEIKEQVKDIVEYKKQVLIHKDNTFDGLLKVLDAASPILEVIKNLDLSKIDWKVIEEIFLAAILKDGRAVDSIEKIAEKENK